MKKYLINGVILSAVVLIYGTTILAQVRPLLGGYKPAETDDERVAAAANFAVEKRVETNTEQEGMTLDSIDKAETQSVAGTNYRLCLTVKIEDETQQVETVVHQNLKQEYSLKSWTVKDCAEKSADNTDDGEMTPQSVNFTPAQTSRSLANCSGEQLALKEVEGESDIGGKTYGNYVFTNISSKPCTLSGFDFALLNKLGKPLTGSAAKITYDHIFISGGDPETSRETPSPVTPETGASAWFQIYYNNGIALERKTVSTSAKVEVTAPSDKRAFIIESVIHTCCGVAVSYVRGGLPN